MYKNPFTVEERFVVVWEKFLVEANLPFFKCFYGSLFECFFFPYKERKMIIRITGTFENGEKCFI